MDETLHLVASIEIFVVLRTNIYLISADIHIDMTFMRVDLYIVILDNILIKNIFVAKTIELYIY